MDKEEIEELGHQVAMVALKVLRETDIKFSDKEVLPLLYTGCGYAMEVVYMALGEENPRREAIDTMYRYARKVKEGYGKGDS